VRKPIIVTPQTPLEDLPPSLTVEEWRIFMRIGRSSAYDLIRRGLVPAIRWGRSVRIPVEAVRRCVMQEGEAKDGILHSMKTCAFGTEDPVTDTAGGQPCTDGNGMRKPRS
jgi:excisionase family DNA binding protein